MILLKWRNVFKAGGGGGIAAEFLAEHANYANEFFPILPSEMKIVVARTKMKIPSSGKM